MSPVIGALARHAEQHPDAPALQGHDSSLSYAELHARVRRLGDELHASGIATLGLLADNGIDWAVADLAALSANIPCVPLPAFFSAQQLLHAIQNSGMNAILTDQPQRVNELLGGAGQPLPLQSSGNLTALRLPVAVAASRLPAHTAKITYTSGTTGQPKGVCLSREAMEQVAQSLCHASAAGMADRHLCLLPLSTLLENIGGIYAPLLAGACSCILPLQQVGLQGASALDVGVMLQAMHAQRASSVIMVPQMLHALVAALGMGGKAPDTLRFIAVGGAPVSQRLLAAAQQFALPVYEGYGLSECASVVAVNAPGANKAGSVGKPLPHVKLRFAGDGEIFVGGAVFEGYLGQAEKPDNDGWWATGDTGYLDGEGYLHLTGRKKNMFITSFGRNVAPEWVERELTIHPVIANAAVFGEARPWNVAIIVLRNLPGVDRDSAVAEAVAAANRSLPDYAQVRKWLLAAEPFTMQNGLLTSNGRLRRAEIWARYEPAVNQLYGEQQ
ncbi:MAG: AMP-binding protein [Sideroxydans sp.]|nr:AMP-binding protein [Sideroxydans sp.]